MNHLPPVEALKGPALNQAVDDLMRNGVDSSAPKPELLRQFHELVYITTMEEEGEVRIHPDEMTRIEKWKRQLKEAIAKAGEPQEPVEPIVSDYQKLLLDTSQPLWHRNLIQGTLNQ